MGLRCGTRHRERRRADWIAFTPEMQCWQNRGLAACSLSCVGYLLQTQVVGNCIVPAGL